MSRSKGSLSSAQAKEVAQELSQILGTPYKYNFDVLRVIEMSLCQRILEQVCEFPEGTPVEEMVCTVEIPLIGDLVIKPSVFHGAHGITNKPSTHFEFIFKPTSSFKQDIGRAYSKEHPELAEEFSQIYMEKVRELYEKMRSEM